MRGCYYSRIANGRDASHHEERPEEFAAALASGRADRVAAFPKADLHCHSILSASLRSIQEWAGVTLEAPPGRMKRFDEMREYTHRVLNPVIYNRQGFEFTADRFIMESIADGVTGLEMSMDVNFIQFYENRENGFFDFVQELVDRRRAAITVRPEIGVSKNRAPSTQVPLADACIDSGLFRSIDLYGNEDARPPEEYRALYRRASARGLKLKAHVGEFGDAGLVERTLRVLDLQEIQHGIAAAASARLMADLRRESIRLNVCPGSNVALSVAADLGHHPVRVLIDNGVRVSINSDDKTIFGRGVSEEYIALYGAGTVTPGELDGMRKESLT